MIQIFKKPKNLFIHENLNIRLITNYIQQTTSGIIFLLEDPSQHFPIEDFHLCETAIGRSQRGFNVAHARI